MMTHDFDVIAAGGAGPEVVYVRAVTVAELPREVRRSVEGIEVLYALHRPDGEQVALVKDRDVAFALARQNDLQPVSVH